MVSGLAFRLPLPRRKVEVTLWLSYPSPRGYPRPSMTKTHTQTTDTPGRMRKRRQKLGEGHFLPFSPDGIQNLSLACAHCQNRSRRDQGQAGLGGGSWATPQAHDPQAHAGEAGAWLLRHCRREPPSSGTAPTRGCRHGFGEIQQKVSK